jgi:O-acetyl-ADP-ribose deacetylase (regulator of RNase III)
MPHESVPKPKDFHHEGHEVHILICLEKSFLALLCELGVLCGKRGLLLNRIEVIQGDITQQRVDAIVNAANESLLGGGGVDGAIHRTAGPELLEECRTLDGCKTGQCKITRGYRLPTHWVIHVVGPVWRGGENEEDELLASCYRNCLKLAIQCQIKTIAFPSISTGAYGFPVQRAARIAVGQVQAFLLENHPIEKVRMVCFDTRTLQAYREVFGIK